MNTCNIQYALIIVNIILIIYYIMTINSVNEKFSNPLKKLKDKIKAAIPKVKAAIPTKAKNKLSTKTFYFYSSPTCGYCTEFQTTFDKLKVGIPTVTFVKVDISDPINAELVAKEGAFYPEKQIKGVPHLVLISGEKRHVFGEGEAVGARSYENIMKFLTK